MRLLFVVVAAVLLSLPVASWAKRRVIRVHLRDAWYPYRAEGLGLSLGEVRERDASFTERQPPPPAFWDPQLAVEVAAIWRVVCNDCHEGKRGVASAAKIPGPDSGWGKGTGLFFGKERPYDAIYRQIVVGGASKPEINSRMPAFKNELSNEQIWGLMFFLEDASRRALGPR